MMQEVTTQPSFIIETKDLSIIYADGHEGIRHVSMGFQRQHVTAIIGPSGWREKHASTSPLTV